MTRPDRRWRSIAVLVVLVVGHLSAGLFIRRLASSSAQIRDPLARQLTTLVEWTLEAVMRNLPQLRLVLIAVVALALVQSLRGGSIDRLLDLLGGLLCLRCALQFLLVNVLLLSPLQDGALLLLQLVLFLPVITIAFGWLYWRLDSGARDQGRRHLRFEEERQGPQGLFVYFHAAAQALVQFEPSAAVPCTRLAKSLFLLHGVVMLDLVALTLSRAIGLASNG